jgi:hypothetical protein
LSGSHLFHQSRKGFRIVTGINNQVNVVGHQAVCIKTAAKLVFALHEIVQVVEVVIIMDKNRLTIVSSVDHMVGIIGNDESTDAGHTPLTQNRFLMNNK